MGFSATDSAFFQRLKARDKVAVNELVNRCYAPVQRYLTRLVGDPEVAAELTQQTFLQAYQALPSLREASNLSAWVFRIATNLALKHQRRQKLIRWLHLDESQAGQEGFEQQVIQREFIGRALDQLPTDYRIGLLLQAGSGLSCAEIAQVMGRTEGATKMMLVRAWRRFREVYEEMATEE